MPDSAPRLRLRSPGEILAAIPYLLGFHPAESIVLIALRGARRRIACTVRWDLGPLGQRRDRERAGDEIRSRLALVGGDAAILAVYTERGRGPRLPLDDVVADVAAALSAGRVPLLEALCVRGGRWRSYLCENERCCPAAGAPLLAAADRGGPTEIAAVAAFAGLAALPSREHLVAALHPLDHAERRATDQALDSVEGELAARGATVEEFHAESLRRFRAAVREYADPPARLEPAAAARLLLGVRDVRLRDEVMGWADSPDAAAQPTSDALRSLLTDLVRRARPSDVAAPATMLAWVAYQQGDGAFARVALDRALAADARYRLALLLDTALTHAVPPAALRSPAAAR